MSEAKLNLHLPSSAIRRIVKLNSDVSGASAEAVILISKLTEEVRSPYDSIYRSNVMFPLWQL
jgi:hypothetical protein